MTPQRYLLDANVLMQARRLHYNPDYCPGFWDWLERQHDAGTVFSTPAVLREIKKGNDNLADLLPKGLFLSEPKEIGPSLQQLSGWVQSLPCSQARKAEFLSGADYFLVAHAHSVQFTVVTHERRSPDDRGKIKIPNACSALGVNSVDLWDLLRNSARFVLG